jgi:hypothetical protein
MLFTLFPLIDNVIRSEGATRHTNELRTAAEIGIDYTIAKLNEYAVDYPGSSLSLPLAVPSTYLGGFPNGTVHVQLKKITNADWQKIKYLSSVYSPSLDPNNPALEPTLVKQDYWLVVESTARRGLLSRSARVILQPAFDIRSSDGGGNGNGNSTNTSYFSKALSARSVLDLSPPDNSTVSISRSPQSTTPLSGYANTNVNAGPRATFNGDLSTTDTGTITVDEFAVHNGKEEKAGPTVIPAPVPSANAAKPLQSITDGSALPSGSYSTSNLDTASLNVSISAPVKIYIQDGANAQSAAQIKTNRISNSTAVNQDGTGGAQNLQIWYNGTRPISIELDPTLPFRALLYAPNAPITMTGTGIFQGALVGNSVAIKSSGQIQIDTDLQNISNSSMSTSGLAYATNSNSQIMLHGYKAVTWKEFPGSLVP